MPRRQRYYGSMPAPPAPLEPLVSVEPLRGARAMAEALTLSPKEFYRLLEANRAGADPIPVEKIPGLGLSADKRTLLAWWARKHRATVAA